MRGFLECLIPADPSWCVVLTRTARSCILLYLLKAWLKVLLERGLGHALWWTCSGGHSSAGHIVWCPAYGAATRWHERFIPLALGPYALRCALRRYSTNCRCRTHAGRVARVTGCHELHGFRSSRAMFIRIQNESWGCELRCPRRRKKRSGKHSRPRS